MSFDPALVASIYEDPDKDIVAIPKSKYLELFPEQGDAKVSKVPLAGVKDASVPFATIKNKWSYEQFRQYFAAVGDGTIN